MLSVHLCIAQCFRLKHKIFYYIQYKLAIHNTFAELALALSCVLPASSTPAAALGCYYTQWKYSAETTISRLVTQQALELSALSGRTRRVEIAMKLFIWEPFSCAYGGGQHKGGDTHTFICIIITHTYTSGPLRPLYRRPILVLFGGNRTHRQTAIFRRAALKLLFVHFYNLVLLRHAECCNCATPQH